MISQPTNIIPSTLSGIGSGVIDVNDGLQISWQVNGNSPMIAYEVVIFQNDAVSTAKYDTGKVTLSAPFYGVDRDGNYTVFEAEKITAEELTDVGIYNGYTNGYKFIITQWWGDGDSDKVTQTSASVFNTRTAPLLEINEITDPYVSRDITVTATYSQEQGDTVSWTRWVLVDTDNYYEVLYDTGKIATSILEFYYDGLFNGNHYAVKLYVQTASGVEVETEYVGINVEYRVAESDGLVYVCRPNNSPYIQIEWKNRTTIVGEPTGTYSVINGILRLDYGATVVWDKNGEDEIAFQNPWSLAWRGQLPDVSEEMVVASFGTSTTPFTISVSPTAVSFNRGLTTIFSQAITAQPNNTLVVVVTPTGFDIKQITSTGGLLPRTDLYPNTTLYPLPVTRIINNYSGDAEYEQDTIKSITLYGRQNCEYVWIYNNEFDSATIENMMGGEWYEPTFDSQTYFLATFLDELVADINGGNGDSLYGTSIFREEKGSSVLKHICDVSQEYLVARDYGAKSRTTYRYYAFQKGRATYISAPFVSDYITPQYSTYMLCECEEVEKNTYHVLQTFQVSGNLSTGAVSNNNKPNIIQNFTAYPSWQPSPNNYRTGTITSLIGDFSPLDNSYSDSWKLANKFMALSTSRNPKFLRDTKGEIWKIQMSSAVTMTVDNKSSVLPIKMSLPWVEVGDSSEDSIVLLPNDIGWERDGIASTSVYIDVDNGMLVWERPDNDYIGSTLSINSSGALLEESSGYIEPAEMHIDTDGMLIASVYTKE